MTLLTRCAHCQRSATQDDLLYCIHCHLSFCRGGCHGDFTAGRWARKPANDTPTVSSMGPEAFAVAVTAAFRKAYGL